jgi:hypothetical protein
VPVTDTHGGPKDHEMLQAMALAGPLWPGNEPGAPERLAASRLQRGRARDTCGEGWLAPEPFPGSPADDTMAGVNVKRLAAIDMHGARGTTRRRRIILAEFVAGVAVPVAFGIWLAADASGLGGRIFGIWMIGAGLNYAPLAGYAIALSRPGALSAELAGVDTGRELRRYSVLQLWILVPLSFVVLAVRTTAIRRA